MAITHPVTFSYALIGDGTSLTLPIDLGSQIAQQGLSASSVPSIIVSLLMSDGSAVTGVLSGQSIILTFAAAPANLAIKTVVMTLGF